MRGLTVATALTVALSATPAVADTVPYLPNPTGHRSVGTTSLHLTDTARADPWVPSRVRELMVSLFYPAAANGRTKEYLTPTESRLMLEDEDITTLPPDVLSTVRTNAVVDAHPAGGRRPLIVLSPGFKKPRATLSSLAEDLASHGYMVAVVGHTYEDVATTFPDGRVTTCVACEVDHLPGFEEKRAQSRAADVSFVLDELTVRDRKWRGLIDRTRIAMAGHSAGGSSTISAMLADSRIRAGINLDGSTHVRIPDPGLSRPFMFVGNADLYVPGAPGPYDDWDDDFQQMTGWKRWLMVKGTRHASFTDLGVLAGQFGIDFGATIDGDRALALTRTYTRAFFDLHLRGKPQPLLAAPDPRFPEVTFIEMPYLPEPTGRAPVGTTSLYLKDTTRADPWVPSRIRELMVSLFYPATSANGRTKQYMTPAESRAMLEEGGITGVPPDALSTVRTNAVVDARPADGRRPLIVLSPGFKKPRATLSTLAEDLASHGYVVVVVDHTYENVATTFPDGRVTTCVACGDYNIPFWQKLERGRAADVSFVLDELTGEDSKWRGLIDGSRIAMVGHSVGGASAVQAMVADSRIRAGIDIDGITNTPLAEPGLSRPFLFLGRQNTYTPGTPGGAVDSWERDWPQLTGWRRWLVVAGMEHASFTDVGVLADQLGLDIGADVSGARGAAITRAYVKAFADRHLRGRPQALLAAPSPRYPEVTFIG